MPAAPALDNPQRNAPLHSCLDPSQLTVPIRCLPQLPLLSCLSIRATFHHSTTLRSIPASTLHAVPIRSPTVPSSPALDFQFAPNRFPPIRYMSNPVTPFLQFQAICLIKQSQIIQSLIPPIALNQGVLLHSQLVVQPLQLNSQCRLPLAFQRHI